MKYIAFSEDKSDVVWGVPVHVVAKLYAHDIATQEPHPKLYSDTYRRAFRRAMDDINFVKEYAQSQLIIQDVEDYLVLLYDNKGSMWHAWETGGFRLWVTE